MSYKVRSVTPNIYRPVYSVFPYRVYYNHGVSPCHDREEATRVAKQLVRQGGKRAEIVESATGRIVGAFESYSDDEL